MTVRFLEEVPEASAEGDVAAVFADIRRVLGVPFVMLIYRVLATAPASLGRIWGEIAPNVADPYGTRIVDELDEASTRSGPRVPGIPAAAFVSLDADLAKATLAAYHRANSLNVVAFHGLLAGVDGPHASSPPTTAVHSLGPLLPMATLDSLPESTSEALVEMSAPIAGREQPLLIPSLLRHFAHDPNLPAALWDALRPSLLSSAFGDAVDRVQARADELAQALPYRIARVSDSDTRATIQRFLRTIPAMIVTGHLLSQALEPVLNASGMGESHPRR